MSNRNHQQGRDGSDRGGRHYSAPDPERRPLNEKGSGRSRHSFAERVASCWPMAILPALVVAYGLRHWSADEPPRLAVLAGLATAYLLNSLFTVWFYREDKRLAERQLRRIPEFHLHFWELFCGWPGALYGQRKYRHKWKKVSYMVLFWMYVLLNLAAAACLIFPDTAWPVAEEGLRLLRGIPDGGA